MPTSPEKDETTDAILKQNSKLTESERTWEEFEIPVPWGKVCAKWWLGSSGDKSEQPVLALHGWQDNAGTFDRLIPLLPKSIPVLCIDLPGHGRSSKYPEGMQYYIFWDGIALIRRIVKKFGWQKIKLLGHSLGGALSFMYASCFPDDVEQYISIDLYGPTVRSFKKYAPMTGPCIDKALSYETLPTSKLPCYTYDEMIDVVLDAYGGSIDRQSAEILMVRGMAPAPEHISKNGYYFTRDLRLKVCLMGMFSLEQVLCYAEQIKCQVLNIRAVPGMKFENDDIYKIVIDTIRKNADLTYVEVPGTHHLHLNTPESVSGIISDFLLKSNTSEH